MFFFVFLIFILAMLVLDLFVFNKQDHVVSIRESLTWTLVWVGIAMLFAVLLYFRAEWVHGISSMEELQALVKGSDIGKLINPDMTYEQALDVYRHETSQQFLAGYFLEESLSIDNIFVMIMIFASFGINKAYYHRVLFWGVLGAIVLRFIFIFTLGALVQRFSWVLAVFGVILLYSGVKMFIDKEGEKVDTANHPIVRFASKHFPVTDKMHGHDFFVHEDGRRCITPLFLVLLVIEFSDVIFAVDSIPAVFSVTTEPSIVFFSNIFAVMGLRQLFFLLADITGRFWLLKYGLGCLLCFIGFKMIAHEFFGFSISTMGSLGIILGILVSSITLSFVVPQKRV